ncbi:MAG TPA: hypothetical protein VF322_07430 [Gammaproteobacteria bacterium]
MERVRQKLAELTSRRVALLDGERAYEFRLEHDSEPPHWLYVSHELIEKHGEQGLLDRLGEVVPHLTTVGQSLRVTLTSNRVRAEPAD